MNAQQLKNSILQMAIQGKLVPQDPSDEPASVLLERIRKEKEQLIKSGKIKRDKYESVICRKGNSYYEIVDGIERCIDEEVPFDVPDNWEWCRFKSFLNIVSARRVHQSDWRSKGIPFYRSREIAKLAEYGYVDNQLFISPELYEEYAKSGVPIAGDLMVTAVGTLGKTYIVKPGDRFYYKDASVLCFENFGKINSTFLQVIMQSPFMESVIKEGSSGTTVGTITIIRANEYLVPLPPLAEQQRIVEKIEELLPFVEKYGDSEELLNKIHGNFPNQLKKSILQLAVQGKLVTQDPSDESASVLLERICKEKEQLIKAGKIKRDKHESVICRKGSSYYETVDGVEKCIDDEVPFDIPDNWEWVRLNEICVYIQRGKSPKYSPVKKYPVIAQKCNQWSGFSIEKAQFIDPDSLASYPEEKLLQDNDLMWNSTGLGTLGRMAIYKKELNPYELAVADSHVTVIRPLRKLVNPNYLYFYFASPTVQLVIEDLADGSTKQKELATATIKKYLVPLPPLSEQNRIVEKVEELLPLIKMFYDDKIKNMI